MLGFSDYAEPEELVELIGKTCGAIGRATTTYGKGDGGGGGRRRE